MTIRSVPATLVLFGSALLGVSGCGEAETVSPAEGAEPATEKSATVTGDEAERPNIVVIMSDDHAYQAISAYGSTIATTPNIDRLAAEGLRFDRSFVGNSICSPSRATFLTGKFSHRNGLRDNRQVFDGTQTTLPKLLREAGYETAVVGKWHLKSDPTGFDHWEVLPGQGEYYNPDFRTADGTTRKEGYVTDLVTEMAIEWLRSREDEEQPFFLMYNHKAPHRDWWPGPDHLRAFKDVEFTEPDTLFDDYDGRGRAAQEAEMRIADHMGLVHDNKITIENAEEIGYEHFLPWYPENYRRQYYDHMNEEQRQAWDAVYDPINEEFMEERPGGDDLTRWKFQRYMEDYLGSSQSVDDNLGRFLDYLGEAGLRENTIVIYTSDQGFYLGEHGWFDKRFIYEESFRTPLIMSWPGHMERGGVREALVQNIDLAPSLLDVAGVDVPEEMQGKSLVPLFNADDPDFREAVYYHYYEYPGIHAVKRHYGLRTDRYKIVHFYYDIDEWELYDLEADPQEMTNLYDDPDYRDVREAMHARLAAAQDEYGDSLSLAQRFVEEDMASTE